jgi:hypothetical protein
MTQEKRSERVRMDADSAHPIPGRAVANVSRRFQPDLQWWPEKIELRAGRLARLSGRALVNENNPNLTIRGEWVGPLEPPK